MKTYEYVELRPHAKSAYEPAKVWRHDAYNRIRCPGCSKPRVDLRGGIDVAIANPAREMVVDILFGFPGIAIAQTHFLAMLGKSNVESTFYLGTVHDSAGDPVATLATLRSKHDPVYVRGNAGSTISRCRECGRLRYLAVGDPYLCGLEQRPLMMQSVLGNLVVRSDLFAEILQKGSLPHVKPRYLDVRQASEDGLPVAIGDAARLVVDVK